MNTAIFWRLVWKEYRQQRALWTAIALAGLIFQIAVLVYCVLNGVSELPDKLFTVALSVPILYSLGCGATLFAGEHEADTFSFQQALPVAAGRVFTAKFVFALLSALALFPVLWLLAFAMTSWKLPDAGWHLQLWGGGVVATIEVLVWAVLGSLVLRRVLPAAVASGLIAVLLGYSSLVLVMLFGGLFQRQVDDYFLTLPLRSACALFAFVAAIVFGRRWFDEQPVWWQSIRSGAKAQVAIANHASKATSLTAMRRLLWQEWRQSRLAILSLVGGYFALFIWFGLIFKPSASPNWAGMLVLLPFLSTVLGARAFWADQQGQHYHFFTEHGVRPRWVWLSRQLVSGSTLLVIAVVACVPLLFTRPHEQKLQVAALGLAVLMFAAGQVCSIFIRSGIVAVFSAVLCSVLLFGWTMFLHELGVWWVVSSLPLPFIFWWATWLYAPTWIQERTAWRVRVATAASIVVPLLGVVAGIAANRVYEIPAIEPSFDTSIVQTPVTPEARKTAQMYSEASALLWNKVSVDANDRYTITSRDADWQRGIDLFVSASKRQECHFPSYSDLPRDMPLYLNELSNAVFAEARHLTSEGSLDASEELYESLLEYLAHLYAQRSVTLYASHGGTAESNCWDELPLWAVHPDQDPDRILKMLNTIQAFAIHNSPNWRLGLLEEHWLQERAAAMDDQVLTIGDGSDRTAQRIVLKIIGTLMPWERWRSSRLADVITETKIEQLAGLDAPLAPGRYPNSFQPRAEFTLTTRTGSRIVVTGEALAAWLRTTPMLEPVFTGANYGRSFDRIKAQRPAVQTQLALLAWRTEHGQLPESLASLLGNPFEALPLDPYTDRPFVYFPNGVEEEIWDDGGMGMAMFGMGGMLGEEVTPTKPKLVRSEPFIWSPSEQIRYAPGTVHSPSDSPTADDFRDQQGNALSDQSLLHQGVQYPIPQSDQQPSDSADNASALPKAE